MVYFVKFYVLLASTVDTVKSLLQLSKPAGMNTCKLRENRKRCQSHKGIVTAAPDGVSSLYKRYIFNCRWNVSRDTMPSDIVLYNIQRYAIQKHWFAALCAFVRSLFSNCIAYLTICILSYFRFTYLLTYFN